MSRDELRTAIRAGEGKQPEVTGVISGKAFMAELDKCQTAEEIYALLVKSMDSKTLADRVGLLQKNYHDNDLIVALENRKARCNAELGFRTSHEAKVIMAAGRFQKIAGNTGHAVKDFKKGLAEYAIEHTRHEQSAGQQIATQILAMHQR